MDEKILQRAHGRKTGIADAICAALGEKGYQTRKAVGKSEFKVDIGVMDPRNPGRYLLGILLDGEGYGTAKTVRRGGQADGIHPSGKRCDRAVSQSNSGRKTAGTD